jgi:DNA-binding NarL/FixJ family response regulator
MSGLHTIVLADDSSVIRRSVRRSLEQAGWTVCGEASNGREAIEKANKFHPQVVILDLSMPEMNGIEAARTLKKTMPEIHLVLLTMHGDVFCSNEADSAGFSAVFSKTDSIVAVVEKVESLLLAA